MKYLEALEILKEGGKIIIKYDDIMEVIETEKELEYYFQMYDGNIIYFYDNSTPPEA
jgi:hypothetical protein